MQVRGLQLKDNKETSTALIAHFKIATMHLALNWHLHVVPKAGTVGAGMNGNMMATLQSSVSLLHC